MKTQRVGIIMNGVTGRMGTNQHLYRSIAAIIKQGGVKLNDDEVIMPDPILVGRNKSKLEQLAAATGIKSISTELDKVMADKNYTVYFDAQTTDRRAAAVKQAIAAGKSVYCEKPVAVSSADALELYHLAKAAGVKNGVVQDKLFLPGMLKLQQLIKTGFFGEILSVRGEFGYWVFDGGAIAAQRPSWNYRKEDGGGIILDMLCHWRYLLDNLFGGVTAVSCLGATHLKTRYDESGKPYTCTADDAAYATFELPNGVICQMNSSWTVRVRRDDLLTLQVDGTQGSAVATLRNCVLQQLNGTPRAVWNPDIDSPLNHFAAWSEVPAQQAFDNAFKIQWEMFLKHIVRGDEFPWTLLEGAKGVQLSEKGMESWRKRAWVNVEPLTA